jgi:hypothetical protein
MYLLPTSLVSTTNPSISSHDHDLVRRKLRTVILSSLASNVAARAALTAAQAMAARSAEVKAISPGYVPFLSKYAPISRKKKQPNRLALKTRCHLDVKR